MHALVPRDRIARMHGLPQGASPTWSRVYGTAVIAAVTTAAVALYALAVFGPPFYTKGEPREAVVVQRMLTEHDFILARRSVDEIPSKPPLFHWLGAIAATLRGNLDEAAVRAPSLLSSGLTIAATVGIGSRMFGITAATAGGIVLATSQQWVVSSVTARVDMVLATCMALSMFSFARAYTQRCPVPTAFWFFSSLAVLAKGPVGWVLPLLAVALFLTLRRDWAYAATVRWARASVMLALPVLWYALAWARGGDEFFEKVVAENLYRMVDADAGAVGHAHSVLFYGPALATGMAPWSVLLPFVFVEIWKRGSTLVDPNRALLLSWAVSTIVFYSLADSKRPVYLLSCYPPLALLAGDWLARRFEEERRGDSSGARALRSIALILAVVGTAAGSALALQTFGFPVLERLRPLLNPSDAANLGPVAASIEARRTLILSWLAVSAGLVAILYRSAGRGAWRFAFASVALLVSFTTAVVAATVFRDLATSQSIRPFVETAVRVLPEDAPLYYYSGGAEQSQLYFFRSFEYAASFYAGRPLQVVDDLALAGSAERFWFIAAEPTLRALRERKGDSPHGDSSLGQYREVGRYTYNDNPRRVPVVFVEASMSKK